MSDRLSKTLDTFYEKVMEMPNRVLAIFNNFFGEERVDMQGFPSKDVIINNIYSLSIENIFCYCSNEPEYILPETIQKKRLMEVNSLSAKATNKIIEAILSPTFIKYCKSRYKGYILVHFPQTRVTNEYNKSTIVNHIYIKVPITTEGLEDGGFTMNRSEYTIAELYSDYMHSHAFYIPISDFSNFVSCCVGSGPLRNTQLSLATTFDEDRWNLFCLELSKFIEVESIAGTPYHRLENINCDTNAKEATDRLVNNIYICLGQGSDRDILKQLIHSFLSYYLDHNNLPFSFRNGVYSIGIPYIEYLINISNSFIEWVNKQDMLRSYIETLKARNIIKSYVIRNGKLYEKTLNDLDRYRSIYKNYIGKRVCTFKGNPVTITISDLRDNNATNEHSITLLNNLLASAFLNRILRTINYRYGRNQEDPSTNIGKIEYKI